MSEIEKMYENAGIEPKYIEGENLMEYSYGTLKYPPFTAEKQLNLTKLIGLRYGLKFITNEGMDYMLSTDLYNNDNFDKQGYGYGYDEAIANLVNNLWQDLTEEEKQQVKGILE
jgi:hypothetical protein